MFLVKPISFFNSISFKLNILWNLITSILLKVGSFLSCFCCWFFCSEGSLIAVHENVKKERITSNSEQGLNIVGTESVKPVCCRFYFPLSHLMPYKILSLSAACGAISS